jgi:hypothetical protein
MCFLRDSDFSKIVEHSEQGNSPEGSIICCTVEYWTLPVIEKG